MHTHTSDIVAVSSMKCGLLPLSQNSLYFKEVAYHDYEGVVTSDSEKVTLTRDLGNTAQVILLRNHGAITVGRSVAEAFINMYFLNKACEIQVRAMSAAGGIDNLHIPSEEVLKLTREQMESFNVEGKGALEFAAFMRKLDAKDPSYRN